MCTQRDGTESGRAAAFGAGVVALIAAVVPGSATAQCQVQRLLPSFDTKWGFGWWTDVQGDRAAVFDGGDSPFFIPATLIYERDQGVWQLRERIEGSHTVFDYQFGPVALSRDWLAVGMPTYDPSHTSAGGGVQTYERTTTGWEERQILTDSSLGFLGMMGSSIAITDRYLAIGASGHAYVYEIGPPPFAGWTLNAKLLPPAGSTAGFGYDVALEGSTLVVCSPGAASGAGPPGAAYVFERVGSTWQQVQTLHPDAVPVPQSFAYVAAVSGRHCLIGSPYLGSWGEGMVHAFEKKASGWELVQRLRPAERIKVQGFGQSIAVLGENAVIAASGPGAAEEADVAYHYRFEGGRWIQAGKLVIDSTQSGNEVYGKGVYFSDADVSLSGTTALLAAPIDYLTNGPQHRPQGLVFAFELGSDSVQYCSCSVKVAPCVTPDSDAGCTNSSRNGAMLSACGSGSVSKDDLMLQARWLPSNQPAIVFMGSSAASTLFGDGVLCVGPGTTGMFRYEGANSGERGSIGLGPGIAAFARDNFPAAGHIVPGDTWYFQAWFRDPNGPCGMGFNLSNGVKVEFTQ